MDNSNSEAYLEAEHYAGRYGAEAEVGPVAQFFHGRVAHIPADSAVVERCEKVDRDGALADIGRLDRIFAAVVFILGLDAAAGIEVDDGAELHTQVALVAEVEAVEHGHLQAENLEARAAVGHALVIVVERDGAVGVLVEIAVALEHDVLPVDAEAHRQRLCAMPHPHADNHQPREFCASPHRRVEGGGLVERTYPAQGQALRYDFPFGGLRARYGKAEVGAAWADIRFDVAVAGVAECKRIALRIAALIYEIDPDIRGPLAYEHRRYALARYVGAVETVVLVKIAALIIEVVGTTVDFIDSYRGRAFARNDAYAAGRGDIEQGVAGGLGLRMCG